MPVNAVTIALLLVGGAVGQLQVPVVDPIPDDCLKVTLEGCVCRDSWTVFGDEYSSCSNPTDFDGDWCAVKPGCYGTPAGKYSESFLNQRSYGYCPTGGCLSPSCVTTLESTQQINTFLKIAQATNVIGLIADNTVLAPTDTVLNELVQDLELDLDNLNNQQLKDLLALLKLHIISGFALSKQDAVNLDVNLPTLSDGNFLEVLNGGDTYQVVGTTSQTNIVEVVNFPNVLCNTAVFIVDAVLSDK
eukprot:TRINITY_DN2605_c0_g1_i1.p2 TRINITY_DN2605_c0_g1~~TRINITY_DN2605_c0_g1_i1.p2  ORF type:complete len:246 (+),score=44.54 TRINITY_DN2605_c0_g1_i1:111-848(+)